VSLKGKRVGFVGAGNMGEALIKGLVEARVVPAEAIAATDVRPEPLRDLERRYQIRLFPDNPELVRHSDVVVLAVKPQIMDTIVRELAPTVTREKLLVSIAAGVSTARIRAALGKEARLLRVMPNTPALVLEGATAIGRAAGLAPGDLETAEELFAAVGKTVVLDESLMDAVTGLSGSGPAYVALVVEALADGGVNMGLDRGTALTLAVQTVLGTARLLRDTGRHPAVLKDMVSSPGGTTIAGVAALEAGGLRAALMQAVEHATLRSRELGRGAG
jgi:pyrroline-5-carboxylate reductase